MNLNRIKTFLINSAKNLNKYNNKSTIFNKNIKNHQIISSLFTKRKFNKNFYFTPIIAANIFSLFKKDDDEETPEDKMIMAIKRSILCIQKEEYGKAEQMLHLALRMAQDLNSKDGITYIYDVMGNLAMERGHFIKAEKLFVDVMKRLFGDGLKEDDIKMLSISSKIAHMAQLQGDLEKALNGFKWTLQKVEEKLKEIEEDDDLLELWGLTKNWYAQLLMDKKLFVEAKKCFLEAYEVYTKIHGKVNEEAIMMLNNLGVASSELGEIDAAADFFKEAILLAKEIPDLGETAIFHANLGLVYFKQGLLKQAEEICGLAWRLGKKMEYDEAVKQANYCLDQLKDLR